MTTSNHRDSEQDIPGMSGFNDMLDPAIIDHLANQMYAMIPGMASDDGAALRQVERHVGSTALPASGNDLSNLLAGLVSPYSAPVQYAGDQAQFYFLTETASQVMPPAAPDMFHVESIRGDFPALHQQVHGKPLVWLDNAATSQKPQSVLDTLSHYYERDNSNIHRGAHTLAARATDAYENAREKVQFFLGAGSPREIVFVRGTTEAINLIAQTFGKQVVGPGDEIILTTMEHHSNIVPWQFLSKEVGAALKVIPINDQGEVILTEYERLLGPRTRIVAFTHVSNALGTVLPVELMTQMAHQYGAYTVIDGAQSIPHFRVNVQAIDADFYVFSGHKVFGPTGIGALYGKEALLEEMPPWQGGGGMIDTVTFEETTFNTIPAKFEAGTPNIGDAVGLGAAIDYLNRIGFEAAAVHEQALLAYATNALMAIPGLRLIGTAPHKAGVLSFVLDGLSPEDVGKCLDQEGVAVRAGHHCAQPTMRRYNLPGTVRASIAIYNNYADIDALVQAIRKCQRGFGEL